MMTKFFGPPQRGGRCRRKPVQFCFEAMESRLLLATPFLVTTTVDNGNNLTSTPGSLRQAILNANNATEPATIDFQIGSGGFQTISPPLPLPTITNQVTIGGTSQPGYKGLPLIKIDGFLAGPNANGLTISAGSSTVQGLDIVRFSGNGIDLNSNGGDVIDSSIIGTDINGTAGLGNAGGGVLIDNVPDNVIGTSLATGNVLSGNLGAGLIISGSGATGNLVLGNYIGTDYSGTTAVGNQDGVDIVGAPDNEIVANLISGNNGAGLVISGSGATGTLVQGNYIGTDLSGTIGIGNLGEGVGILDASNNTIGGTTDAERNVISYNGSGAVLSSDGVLILNASANLVEGNLIGTDLTGVEQLDNVANGVNIVGSSANTIGGTTSGARNIISGNGSNGISIVNASYNLVQGNYIGIDSSGSDSLRNINDGISLQESSSNTIGGTTEAARNVIASGSDGIFIQSASKNLVEGNYIGTDFTGTKPLSNQSNGVDIDLFSSANTIGGTTSGSGNVIAGSYLDGVRIAKGSAANLLQGNFIGTNSSGSQSLYNSGDGVNINDATENTIGGTVESARNVISGNVGDGVRMNSLSTGNLVQGNSIGTNVDGTQHLANLGNGVEINLSSGNTIGGTTFGAGNIISSNGGDGVIISRTTLQGNAVQGNLILSNSGDGVSINLAVNNTVGGAGEPARNIISGNVGDGVRIIDSSSANLVQGNFIGTNLDGTQRFGNLGNGVEINSFSSANTIGGTTEAARNVISGNGLDGILIQLSPANPEPGNYVQGNYIGTDQSGTNSLGNLHNGVSILDAPNNLIGGILTGAGNVISGNGQDGILIVTINVSSGSTGDLVQGNFIGTDATGANPLGNQDNGVALTGAAGITIGGTTARARNIISSNILNGIAISDILPAQDGKPQVIIVGNFIGTDATGTRNLGNAADGVLLDTAASNLIGGTTPEARNILSGNSVAGVEIRGGGSSLNLVQGNYIGTDTSGEASLANLVGVFINGAKNNTIGGTDPGAGNLISGNSNPQGSGVGVQILGFGATGNLVEGNYIGTDLSGDFPLGNDTGVFINGAAANTIGGTVQGARNVIAGYTTASAQGGVPSGVGVDIANAGASDNLVEGNLIGTDATGERALVPSQQPASGVGVLINNTSGSNTIGGVTAAARNVISGFVIAIEIYAPQSPSNPEPGNTVEGNYIGTNALGVVVAGLGNTTGIFINGVPSNTIGGTARGAGNVISGNTTGIYLLGPTTSGNLVQGNYIGLDPTGTSAEPNHTGIFVNDAMNNTIGGTARGAGNVIAGNLRVGQDGSTGIFFYQGAAGNLVQGNLIGTNASGKTGKRLGLGDYGILLYNAPRNTYPTRGKGANKIRGSGIAATREFSSGKPLATTSGTTSKGKAKSVPSGPRAHVRRPRSRK